LADRERDRVVVASEERQDFRVAIREYFRALRDMTANEKALKDDKALILVLEGLAIMLKHQIHEVIVKDNKPDKEEQIKKYLVVILKMIFPVCEEKIKSTDGEIKKIYEELYKRFWALVAFRSVEHFAYYMDWNRTPDKKVWIYSMPSMRGIFYYANKMILGDKVKLLRASCPVSYGKTYAFNTIATYSLGVNPQFRVLMITESEILAKGIVRNVKRMICSEEFAEVFPEFAKYEGKESEIFSSATNFDLTLSMSVETYSLVATTRLGASNGLRCDLLILDDLTKGVKDAANTKLHAEIVSQFDNVWNARSDGIQNNRIIAGGTMWADYDLLNVLEKRVAEKQKIIPHPTLKYTRVSEDGTAVFVGVPNLDYDTDESTLPHKFPTEYLRNLRDNVLEPEEWWARCQQRPIPPKGVYFQWKNLKQYESIPEGGVKYAVLDPPRTGKNYFTLLIFKKIDDLSYFIDCVYRLETTEKCLDAACAKLIHHKVVQLHLENNVDTSLGELIKKRCRELASFSISISTVYSTQKKEEKIASARNFILEHIIFPKKGMFARNSEMGMALEHITLYSFEHKNDYDDSIDALAMYALKYHSGNMMENKIVTINRRIA